METLTPPMLWLNAKCDRLHQSMYFQAVLVWAANLRIKENLVTQAGEKGSYQTTVAHSTDHVEIFKARIH